MPDGQILDFNTRGLLTSGIGIFFGQEIREGFPGFI